MRKLIALLLVVLMLLPLIACGGTKEPEAPVASATEAPQETVETPAEEPTAEPTPEPTAAPTAEPKTEFYEQLAQLPTLDSVTGVQETGKNSFTSNGRYSSIKYFYEVPEPEQIERYQACLNEYGFRLESESDTEYVIYYNKITVGTIVFENGKATLDIVPESIAIINMGESVELHIGDVKTVEGKSDIQLLDVFFTDNLKYKSGRTTYKRGESGKFYLVLQTKLTNKKSSDFDRYNSGRLTDISAILDSQYVYKGEYWAPLGDIVPLTEGDVFIVYEVPESAETSEFSFVAYFKLDGTDYSVTIR